MWGHNDARESFRTRELDKGISEKKAITRSIEYCLVFIKEVAKDMGEWGDSSGGEITRSL